MYFLQEEIFLTPGIIQMLLFRQSQIVTKSQPGTFNLQSNSLERTVKKSSLLGPISSFKVVGTGKIPDPGVLIVDIGTQVSTRALQTFIVDTYRQRGLILRYWWGSCFAYLRGAEMVWELLEAVLSADTQFSSH